MCAPVGGGLPADQPRWMKKDQEGIGEFDTEEGVEDLEIEWGPELEMEERGILSDLFP